MIDSSNSLKMLQDITRAVNSSLILEDIFESLAEVLGHYIPFQEASIVILDDSQNSIKTLVRMDAEGLEEISTESNAFAGYDPVVDAILKDPSPRRYDSQEAFPSLMRSIIVPPHEVNVAGEPVPFSTMIVPLINKGLVIGLIAMIRQEGGSFSAADQEQLIHVSEPLAVAVENAKFYWQTQSQASREFLINQIIKSIRQSLDVDTILNTAVGELGRVMGVSRCIIKYFKTLETSSHPNGYLYRMPGVPNLTDDNGAFKGFGKTSFEQEVFRFRQRPDEAMNPFVLNDYRDCPPQLATPAYFEENQIKSLAVFPILIRQELVGTITLQQCDAFRSWIVEDISLLEAIGEHLGIALNQAQLFGELDQKNRELEKAMEELQQAQVHLIQSEKMAVLGQFVAGIAHEVNTPLGTMTSNNATLNSCVQKIEKELAGKIEHPRLFETMHELIDLNKLASERIQEIIKNLRNFTRLDESELKSVDLHEGINSTLLVMRGSLSPYIKIHKEFDETLPLVQCYPGLLNQVVMNLVVNATHAMGEMHQGDITIRTRYLPEEAKAVIELSDTGTGITPENLLRIFDPGFTTKRRGLGTGLGLALCFKIIEKHKGRILVDSEVGKGTTFRVEIPIKQGVS